MRRDETGHGARVMTVGLAYRDLVMTGLDVLPAPGEERYATALHETWGGIANMTRVCAALGLDVALCSAVGDDEPSARFLADMGALGVDTTATAVHPGWSLPVTVALSLPHERAMVTVETSPPAPPGAHLDRVDADAIVVDLRDEHAWLPAARAAGARVFASRGYDPSERWDPTTLGAGCDVWMLNELEARAYTRLEDPAAAARELAKAGPTVVVTRGADGLLAVEPDGASAAVPAFPVTPHGTTGAGDTTLAAYTYASLLPDLTLAERLDLAALVAAVTIERPGGVAAPPRRAQILARLEGAPGADRYGFARDLLATHPEEGIS